MPERRLLRMGNPLLSRPAAAVTAFATEPLLQLVRDLFDTMVARGGVGLAAPQVGVGLRVLVLGTVSHPRYPNAAPIPHTALINPQLEFLDGALDEDWEGCLSLPGMRGWVPRYRRVHYAGYDAQGQRIEREVDGFHARVVQHECDHLDGMLYPQRMRDLGRFGFEEELSLAGKLADLPC
ncbi:MAG: peptide deformylase [Gammaproteobacteria bacterium]